jgi:hypothetical protein
MTQISSKSLALNVAFEQLEFLGASVIESHGEPWTLQARFLTDEAWLGCDHSDQMEWRLGGIVRKGYVSSWKWHAWNRSKGILEMEAGALPKEAHHITRQRIIPTAQGVQGLIKTVFGNAHEWTISTHLQVPSELEQWIQCGETDWEFLARILRKSHAYVAWENNCAIIFTTSEQNTESKLSFSADFWNKAVTCQDSMKRWSVQGYSFQNDLCVNKRVCMNAKYPFPTGTIYYCEHSISVEGSVLGVGPVKPYKCVFKIKAEDETHPKAAVFLQRPLLVGTIACPQGSATNSPFFFEGGGYAIRLPWGEHGETAWGKSRMLQAYVASQGGMHYALLPGTPVLIGFEPGQPDQLLILGALPDQNHPSPALHQKPDRQLFCNPSGSSIILEGNSLTLCTGTVSLHLCAKPARLELNVNDQGKLVIEDGASISLDAQRITVASSGNLDLQGQFIHLN